MRPRLCLALLPLLAASPALAYDVKTTGDIPLRWADGVVPVNIGLDDGPLQSGSARGAAGAAVATFTDELQLLATNVTVASDESTEALVTMQWVHEGWDVDYIREALAVTSTSFDPDTGRIRRARIAVNAEGYHWMAVASGMDGCESAFDLQTVLTHELGHALGLAHSTIPEATMYPSVSPCASAKRTLIEDDVRALEYLYVENALTDVEDPLGCAVGARGGAGLAIPLAMVAAALALGRRRRRALAAVVALVVAGAGGAARATTLRRLSFGDLGQAATLVVRAEVMAVSETTLGDKVYTDAVLATSGCLKGRCAPIFTVRQLGGTGFTVEGSASFSAGNSVIVYLRPRPDGRFGLVGMAQGTLRVERPAAGGAARLTRDLRDLVLVGDDVDGVAEESVTMDVVLRSLAK